MPKLDGVSATSLIRQFDHMTPIISMTSNSKPDDITKYYSSGMNDILPKPFTKDGLLEMLEVSRRSKLLTADANTVAAAPHAPQSHPNNAQDPPLSRHPPTLGQQL